MKGDPLSILAISAIEFSVVTIVMAVVVSLIVLAIMEAIGRAYINFVFARRFFSDLTDRMALA